jgi:hypothetical protein
MTVAATKEFSRVIEVEGVKQVFHYDTAEELADLLTVAQTNASQKIADQAKELRDLRKTKVIESPAAPAAAPVVPPGSFQAKELSAEDRHRIAMNLQNPDTSAAAITEAIELGLGGSIGEIRRALAAGAELARQQEHRREGAKFRNANPDFMLYDEQTRMDIEKDIYDWMTAKRCPFTAEWIQKAYEDLGAHELLPPVPKKKTANEAQPGELPAGGREGNSSTSPRAAFSTALRRDTGTVDVPKPGQKDPKQVWDEIDAMTPEEFDRKMLNTEFRNMVNALPSR